MITFVETKRRELYPQLEAVQTDIGRLNKKLPERKTQKQGNGSKPAPPKTGLLVRPGPAFRFWNPIRRPAQLTRHVFGGDFRAALNVAKRASGSFSWNKHYFKWRAPTRSVGRRPFKPQTVLLRWRPTWVRYGSGEVRHSKGVILSEPPQRSALTVNADHRSSAER